MKKSSFILALAFGAGASVASAATLTNGDFETGNRSGWAIASFNSGETLASDVRVFDTSGAGASNALRLNVGHGAAAARVEGGIVLSQGFDVTTAGIHNFSVDVAFGWKKSRSNSDAGRFELLVNGIVQDTYDINRISRGQVFRDNLSGSVYLGLGASTVGLRVTRTFDAARGITGFQYVDNFSLMAPAPTSVEPVPLPAGLPLLLMGLGGFAVLHRRR